MKPAISILLSIIISISFSGCSQQKTSENYSREAFKNPPRDVRVHTWWHWLDGAITKEGISKDLASMNKQGITQATILNIGLFNGKNFGVDQVKFNTPEWYSMFEWALKEADSLGISIGAHNCDGWSTSGGPWITPEMSMKQFVWTTSFAEGGKNVSLVLPRPLAVKDFYRDVAVIAYKSAKKANSFRLASPTILLNDSIGATGLADGSPVSSINLSAGGDILFRFNKPFTASKITLYPRQVFSWQSLSDIAHKFVLYYSTDGRNFKEAGTFQTRGVNKNFTFNFPAVTALTFKLTLEGNAGERRVNLGEVELMAEDDQPSYNPDIPCHMAKVASVKADSMGSFSTIPGDQSPFIQPSDIVDLTGQMKEDGSLQWEFPGGNWTIIRFGYTSTGSTNGPATAEGRGLECDKMDTAALNLHWRNYPQKLIDHAGKYAGNTFKFLLIDSWECGYQNWSGQFTEEFQKRRGYDLKKYIPVLCGEAVENAAVTEGVLYDFRKTIADLIGENYYRHFGELCHENGLEYHAEAIYGELNYPPLEILKANGYIDLPMFEFWANTNDESFVNYEPSPQPGKSFPAASSVIYDKPVIGTEAYTGMAHYSETPQALKPFGDRAFCMGLNQIILHSYVHQPMDKPAGMTLGPFGAHFNRLNPWYQFASGWIDYQSRIQYILQQGKTAHNVLYYIGDQLPQTIENPVVSGLPFGYSGQACNPDALMNMVDVKNGKLTLPDGLEYDLLILPAGKKLELNTLKRLEELVNKGAIVYGEKPTGMFSLGNIEGKQAEFETIVETLWGNTGNATEHATGKGKVIWGKPIPRVLAAEDILPSFSTNQADSMDLMFIHKIIGKDDVFFVYNQQNKPLNRQCLFKAVNEIPEIWEPADGTVTKPAVYRREGKQVRLLLSFEPYESKIIIFTRKPGRQHIETINKGNEQVFAAMGAGSDLQLPPVIIKGNKIVVVTGNPGEYHFFDAGGDTVSVTTTVKKEEQVETYKTYIEFHAPYGQFIKPVESDTLLPLNEYKEDGIRYFSGTAKYGITFNVPEQFLSASDSFMIRLNIEHATGSVKFNGKDLGTIWEPGSVYPVGMLKHVGNLLIIEAGIPYRNRFIGDLREYGEMKNIWSSAPVTDFLHADSPLLENGVVSPVTVIGFGKAR